MQFLPLLDPAVICTLLIAHSMFCALERTVSLFFSSYSPLACERCGSERESSHISTSPVAPGVMLDAKEEEVGKCWLH